MEEHRYTQAVRMRIRICRRHRPVQIHLDVIQILPKTNNILNIINNDQRILVRIFQN